MTEFAALIERRPPGDQPSPEGYDWTQSALRLVLTLRDDYLHELERWKKLIPALMRNRVELRELRGPDALNVVLLPARKGPQALIEPDVAQQLVCFVAKRDAGTPLDEIDAVPPLLSLLCAELNAARIEAGAAKITQAQLQGEADKVLERFYQRCFDGMPNGVRRAVEDLLIDNGGRIREASSQDTVLSEMLRHGVVDSEGFLKALVDGRLLTIEERAGAPRVELTHDLLVPLVARARDRREAEEMAEAQRIETKLATDKARIAKQGRWIERVFLVVFLFFFVWMKFLAQKVDTERKEKMAAAIVAERNANNPNHPLTLLRFAQLADSALTKPQLIYRSFLQIEAKPEYATRAAEIFRQDKDPENAKRAAEIALKRDPNDTRAKAVLDWANASLKSSMK